MYKSITTAVTVLTLTIVGTAFAQTPVDNNVQSASRRAQYMYKNLESQHWIAEGAKHPKRIVYAFHDPNCPYCRMFWGKAQKYYDKGLQVRYILVSVLGKSSLHKAAAILSAKNPRLALDKNERGFSHDSGAIAPLKNVPDKLRAEIDGNNALFHRFGFDGPPGLVWKNDEGKVKIQAGFPGLDKVFDFTGETQHASGND